MQRILCGISSLILAVVSFVSSGLAQAIITTSEGGNGAVVFPTPGSNLPSPNQIIVTGFPLGASPHGVAYFGSNHALVSDLGKSRIFIVSISTASVEATLDTSAVGYLGYGSVAVSPDFEYALACGDLSSKEGTSKLFVIAAPFNATSKISVVPIPGKLLSYQTQGIGFDHTGRAYVYHTSGISVLNPPYRVIAFTIPVSGNAAGGALAVTLDGQKIIITDLATSTLRVFTAPFSANSLPASKSLRGANRLDGICVTPDGSRLLVADVDTPMLFGIGSPFETSPAEGIPMPSSLTASNFRGFEDIGVSHDGRLAIATGNDHSGAPAALIHGPFTSTGATVYTINLPDGGRGTGAARFLPPGLATGLTISAKASTVVAPRDELTYTLTYSNTGATAITAVVVKSEIPEGTSFDSASTGGNVVGGNVIWNVGSLYPGYGSSVSFTVKVGQRLGSIVNHDYSIEGTGFFPLAGPPVRSLISAWLLPSSARVAGVGGTFWTTDLTVANTGSEDANISLQFLFNNIDGRLGPQKSFSVPAGATVTYPDVLASVFGFSSGFGAILLSSSSPNMMMQAQTSTPGGGGTYGQSVPAVTAFDVIQQYEPRAISSIREDARFRTNLILANAVSFPVDVDVALVSSGGVVIGTKQYSLLPLEMTQDSQVVRKLGITGNVVGAQLVLSTATPGGAFAAYAPVIDNVTGDPRTLLPSSEFTWLLPSSARSGAASASTVWTTDLTLSNSGIADAAFTLKFLGNNRRRSDRTGKKLHSGSREICSF